MITSVSSAALQTSGSPEHRKLLDAAQQFEAIFLDTMLKSANFFGDEEEGGASTVAGMGTEAVSKAIAAAGGCGVARHLVAAVEAEHARHLGVKENSHDALKESPGVSINSL